MLTYKDKVIDALNKCKSLEDFDYILEKIQSTDKINRRTKDGRELTDNLINLVYQKREEVINKNNLQPF